MPDFQIIKVRAPVAAEITYRGEQYVARFVETFEIPIAFAARADAGLAAAIRFRSFYGEAEAIERLAEHPPANAKYFTGIAAERPRLAYGAATDTKLGRRWRGESDCRRLPLPRKYGISIGD